MIETWKWYIESPRSFVWTSTIYRSTSRTGYLNLIFSPFCIFCIPYKALKLGAFFIFLNKSTRRKKRVSARHQLGLLVLAKEVSETDCYFMNRLTQMSSWGQYNSWATERLGWQYFVSCGLCLNWNNCFNRYVVSKNTS